MDQTASPRITVAYGYRLNPHPPKKNNGQVIEHYLAGY